MQQIHTDLTEPGTSSTEAPKRILIEGAPGIGKTVLAKEIAYQWATNEILTEIKIVFLLYLRDPYLQKIISTKELVQYMSMGCLDDEQVTTLDKYFVNGEGQQLCIVMDGFDEYPTLLQENSFIVDIINGVVLPQAIVVITSRPTATVSLHDRVDRRIDILGLPKEERDKYISQTLKNLPEKNVQLDKYLKQQPVINGLCFVPLHLAILLYLFQQGSLPETLTEMNESFILHTIYRHLKKHGQTPSGGVDKLAKVPKPVLDIVYKLSELAFKGLQENKLVFTFDEIKKVCPYVDETVGAINGFGLLQAVEHYPHKGAGTTTSFNFLHYTMQEFLAALHVSNLPSEQQSSMMKKTFWDGHYNFMWMMFVGIVGIMSDIFVNFVSKGKVYKRKSGIRMAENILSDKRKRLHVFQCYMEAKSSTEAPDVISDMFKGNKIIINGVKLLPQHISSLMTFMSNSSMQWETLELKQCNITYVGMSVLEQFISEHLSTLEYVDLSGNESSPWGVYCAIIKHCSINNLTLSGIQASEMKEYVSEITESLQKNTSLISLTLCNILENIKPIKIVLSCITTCTDFNIPCRKVIDHNDVHQVKAVLFHTILQYECDDTVPVSDNNRIAKVNLLCNNSCDGLTIGNLNSLDASHQCIDDYGVTVIATFCDRFKILNLSSNKISNHGALAISDCIKSHTSLLELNISMNTISDHGARGIAEAIQVNTVLQKLDLSTNKITYNGAAAISDSIKTNTSLQALNMSGNYITSEGAQKIAEAIRANKILHTLNISNAKISDDGVVAISNSLKFNNSLQSLNISHNSITNKGAIAITKSIQVNSILQNINISKNQISLEGLLYFMEAVKNNCTLQVVNITHNNVTRSGFTSIKQCIENSRHPIQIYASWNEIISRNGELLVISKICIFQDPENIIEEDEWSFEDYDHDHIVTCLSECLKEDDTLLELNMSKNQIIRGREKKIIEAIKVNKTLLKLDASFTKIRDEDYISDCLKINKSLKELNISGNMITSNGAKEIATAIRVNTTLKKLDLSCNKISDDGVGFISDGLKNNNSLQELNISRNEITSEGAQYIAEAIQVNTTQEITEAIQINSTLQNINISKNQISPEGLLYFMEAVNNNCTLQVVNITHNNVTRSGFTSIKQCIENLQHPIQIYASWNEINKSGELVTKISTCRAADNIEDDVWSFDVYDADHLVMCVSECLKEDDTLQELSMHHNMLNFYNKITSEGAKMIAEAIKVNKILKKLDINENSISDDGAAAISDGLKYNISLQELNMSNNKITSEGAKMISEAIKVNKILKKLDIHGNSISDDGAAAISDSLKCNISLQELNMSYNDITSEGANMIAEAIKVNKILKKLDINENSISDDGAAAISDSLKCNISLQELNISRNNITSEGAKMIGEAIKVNKILKKLVIYNNSISDDGAAAISDGLKYNISLQELHISYNGLTNEGAKMIAEAIKVNTTLHTLHHRPCSINDELSFNMTVLTAVYHNNTIMELSLPYGRLVSSEVEKINKERARQGISTLTCYYW